MRSEGIRFRDEVHKDFFLEKLGLLGEKPDGYWSALLYLLALCPDTRLHFTALVNVGERSIRPEALHKGWQTSTSRKVTRLAFNLCNGCISDDEGDTLSAWFAPDELFCCCYQPYFFEAIRLRFPEYANG